MLVSSQALLKVERRKKVEGGGHGLEAPKARRALLFLSRIIYNNIAIFHSYAPYTDPSIHQFTMSSQMGARDANDSLKNCAHCHLSQLEAGRQFPSCARCKGARYCQKSCQKANVG